VHRRRSGFQFRRQAARRVCGHLLLLLAGSGRRFAIPCRLLAVFRLGGKRHTFRPAGCDRPKYDDDTTVNENACKVEISHRRDKLGMFPDGAAKCFPYRNSCSVVVASLLFG
jgi:hypothetical protein